MAGKCHSFFCSDAFPPWRYSFLLLEKSVVVPCLVGTVAQRDAKLFKGIFFRSSLRKWLLSRLFTRQPFLTFLYLPFFFFFFTTCYVIPRSNFPRFFPCPDFHGFLDIAGSTTFFSPPPSSSKMEGIKTRHFNAASWPTSR